MCFHYSSCLLAQLLPQQRTYINPEFLNTASHTHTLNKPSKKKKKVLLQTTASQSRLDERVNHANIGASNECSRIPCSNNNITANHNKHGLTCASLHMRKIWDHLTKTTNFSSNA